MVRLPALITEYAKLDGRPRSTIAWYARLAREAGKLPTTKRGLGASHMGVREAVNLILACNGAEDPKEGAGAVDRFRSCKGVSYDLEDIEDEEMREIGLQSTFGQALEELIRQTPYLFGTFDEGLSLTHPTLSINERFHIVKTSPCVKIEDGSAWISIGAPYFNYYDSEFLRKNRLTVDYYEELRPISEIDLLKKPANLRETDVSLRFGIFMGLAKLFFEDSMQFPDELIPQSIGGGGDA